MAWLRHIALVVVFVTALVRPAAAGAFSSAADVNESARVGGFELVTVREPTDPFVAGVRAEHVFADGGAFARRAAAWIEAFGAGESRVCAGGAGGFLPAGLVRPGRHFVDRDTNLVEVTSASLRATSEQVYNLEVAGAHTYRVGDLGLWVHNTCTPAAGGGAEITAAEIRAISRGFGSTTELTGSADAVIANMAYREGAMPRAATAIRDIAGRHLFDDANKRTAQAVAERLLGSGADPARIRAVIDRWIPAIFAPSTISWLH